jgi:hypothetical protein
MLLTGSVIRRFVRFIRIAFLNASRDVWILVQVLLDRSHLGARRLIARAAAAQRKKACESGDNCILGQQLFH